MTRAKLQSLLSDYGNVALVTYLVIWLLTLAGFATAISFGFDAGGAASGVGLIGASWVATKLTQPLRIAGTLAATPVVAAVYRKFRPKAPEPEAPPEQPQS